MLFFAQFSKSRQERRISRITVIDCAGFGFRIVSKKMTMRITLPDFSTARVLVVGDIMLDRYCTGPTRRISPEARITSYNVCYTKLLRNHR